jgi:hypothetical protein
MSETETLEAADAILRRIDFQKLFHMGNAKFFEMRASGKLPFFRKVEGTLLTTRQEAMDWFRSLPSA